MTKILTHATKFVKAGKYGIWVRRFVNNAAYGPWQLLPNDGTYLGPSLCESRSPTKPVGFFCTLHRNHYGDHLATDTLKNVLFTW